MGIPLSGMKRGTQGDKLGMNERPKPRLSFVEPEYADMALASHKAKLGGLLDMIASEPVKLPHSMYNKVADRYKAIGRYLYALGFPMETVKDAIRKAANAYLEVFRLRGTDPAFPAYTFTYDPNHAPGTPESILEFKPIHGEGAMDYSLTNSHKGFAAVCEALIAGEDELATRIAGLIWDPPNASYIGPRSFCTPNDQHLGYGLREFFGGCFNAMEAELAQIRVRQSDDAISHQASMLQALATKDDVEFCSSLDALLVRHAKLANSKKNRRDTDFYICTRGLGLCRLALRHRNLATEDLPQDNVFLPVELITTET